MRELEKAMYYGVNQITFEKARRLRSKETPAELKLWECLKGKQISGLRFRRQHPIETFIVDFYCHKAKLVIEIDGKIHLRNRESDKNRTTEIEKHGLKVIRFTNNDIMENSDMVLNEISRVLKSRLKEKP